MMRDALAPLSEHYLQAFRCEIVSSARLSQNLGGSPQPIRRRNVAGIAPDYFRSEE
jgi:hypothetical protein